MNPNLSDIFFNMDHSSAIIYDKKGNFQSWSLQELYDIAKELIENLTALGVSCPEAKEFVSDFISRV